MAANLSGVALAVLKVIIVILLICVVLSLMSGLVFLFKDTGKPESRRLWYALGVRITFATLLLLATGLWILHW
jgi:hypothetical protein